VTIPFRWRKLLQFSAGICLVGVALYIFRINILMGVFDFLTVKDELSAADVILILNGDTTVRPIRANELYQQKLAPKIVIARAEDSPAVQMGAYPNVTDSNIIAMEHLGVPASAIEQLRIPGGVTSTLDEARALQTYAAQHPVRRVIVVTNELHSRRAKFILQKVLGKTEVFMAPIPDRKYDARNWWKNEDGIIGCQNEYIKLLVYYWRYADLD
jgi:uncharacterized SAM-binding protein YcdF (DUF218 family)